MTLVGNATAVPDYCGLLLNLPTVPVPGDFTEILSSILNETLSGLPGTDLAGVLNGLRGALPSSTLSRLPL